MKLKFLFLLLPLVTATTQTNQCQVTTTNSINQSGTHTITVNRVRPDFSDPLNLASTMVVEIVYPYTITAGFSCRNELGAATTCSLLPDGKTIQINNYFTKNYQSIEY